MSLFYSKDTVVALQALVLFNDITLSAEIHKTLRFHVPGLAQPIIKVITQSSRFDNLEIEVGKHALAKECVRTVKCNLDTATSKQCQLCFMGRNWNCPHPGM